MSKTVLSTLSRLPALLLAGLCCCAAATAAPARADLKVERLDNRIERPPTDQYPFVTEQFLWRSGDNYDHVGVEQHCSRLSARRTQDCVLLLLRYSYGDSAGGEPTRSVLDALHLRFARPLEASGGSEVECRADRLGDSYVHAVATWQRSAPGQQRSARVAAAWSVDASQLRFRDIDPAGVRCSRDDAPD
ncbi:MAG: hypothetical protein RJA44_941 [Pseudomonadota bacterium]|jgi:hypothetical protein